MPKRNVQIIFRLTREEADALRKRVKKSGVSREKYLRLLLRNLVPTDKPPPAYFAMMRELNAIGNNLNQIAHKAHAIGVIDAKWYIENVVKLDQAIINITNAVMLPRKVS